MERESLTRVNQGFPPEVVRAFGYVAGLAIPAIHAVLFGYVIVRTWQSTTAPPVMGDAWLIIEPIFAGAVTAIVAWGIGVTIEKQRQHLGLPTPSKSSTFLGVVLPVRSPNVSYPVVSSVLYLAVYFGLAIVAGIVWGMKGSVVTADVMKALVTMAIGAIVAAGTAAMKG